MVLVGRIEEMGSQGIAVAEHGVSEGGGTEPGVAPAPARKRGRPSKRGLRREALLEGAAGMFNARGIAATALADIAEGLGLSRATVYYYVNDRAELVFQCYLRACELMAEDLAAAAEAPDGLSRTLSFIEHALNPDRPPAAVLTEIDYLEGAHAEIVKIAHARNVAALTGFIEAGVTDGSIRPCDRQMAAQAIIGMTFWARMSPGWVQSRDSRAFRVRLRKALIGLMGDGLACDPSGELVCAISADSFLPGRFNAFDRREASEVKIDQLLTAASRLFNRNGIEATGLEAITESVGATKGVLYHYLRDKADLVLRCYERAFDLYDRFAETASNQGANGLERALIGTHLNVQAQAGELSPLMPQPGLEALSEPGRTALTARANRLHNLFIRLLRKGMADGSCQPCDAPMIALLGAGPFAWLPKWLPPDDPRSPRQLADEVCALYFKGLRAR